MQTSRLRMVLLGKSLTKAGHLVCASAAALVGVYLLLSHTGSLGEGINRWLGTNYNLLVWMLLLVVVGAKTSFSNNGVLVSLLLVAAPLSGYFLSGNVVFATEPTLGKWLMYTVQGAVLYGLPLGIVGYGLGRALRAFKE